MLDLYHIITAFQRSISYIGILRKERKKHFKERDKYGKVLLKVLCSPLLIKLKQKEGDTLMKILKDEHSIFNIDCFCVFPIEANNIMIHFMSTERIQFVNL